MNVKINGKATSIDNFQISMKDKCLVYTFHGSFDASLKGQRCEFELYYNDLLMWLGNGIIISATCSYLVIG